MSTVRRESTPQRPSRGVLPGTRHSIIDVLSVCALCGLVITGPVLDSFSRNATYFVVAGRDDAVSIVSFLLLWLMVPAIVAMVPIVIARRFMPRLYRLVVSTEVGVLAGLWIISLLPGWKTWPEVVWLVVTLLLGLGAGSAYTRLENARLFLAVLVVGPVALAGIFLTSPSVASIISGAAPEVDAVARNETPVAFIVFDEFSLGLMLTTDGRVNDALFPNFADLAATGTWYPNATTAAGSTTWAIPSLLTGLYPDVGSLPVQRDHPRNLFSMFGDDVVSAQEYVSRLCSSDNCSRTGSSTWKSILRTSSKVAAVSLLPESMGSSMFGGLSEAWSEEESADGEASEDVADVRGFLNDAKEKGLRGERAVTTTFIAEVGNLMPGSLLYAHLPIPHGPFERLHTGQQYTLPPTEWMRDAPGSRDPFGEVVTRQRALAQASYADMVLGELMAELRTSPLFDDTLIVVTSDHGLSMRPDLVRRNALPGSQEGSNDVLPVPLFIKYPGQNDSVVDTRDARLVDVVPTIVEVTDAMVTSEWSFDGVSLLRPAPIARPVVWFGDVDYEHRPDPVESSRRTHEVLGPRAMMGNLFAVGPHPDLLGTEPEFVAGTTDVGTCIRTGEPQWAESLTVGPIPALVQMLLDDVESGTWLAGIINNHVAGFGPAYRTALGEMRANILLDPQWMTAAAHSFSLAVVDDKGALTAVGSCRER